MNEQQNMEWSSQELSNLKTRLMRRVYFSWFLKKALGPALIALPLAGLVLFLELSHFNLRVIANNILGRLWAFDLAGLWKYFFAAIRETERDALMVLLSTLLLAAFFARKLIRDTIAFWSQSQSDARLVKSRSTG